MTHSPASFPAGIPGGEITHLMTVTDGTWTTLCGRKGNGMSRRSVFGDDRQTFLYRSCRTCQGHKDRQDTRNRQEEETVGRAIDATVVKPVPVLPYGIDARRCNICRATGAYPGTGETCKVCEGSGYVLSHYAACCGTTFTGTDPMSMHVEYHNVQHARGRRTSELASDGLPVIGAPEWQARAAAMERHPAGKRYPRTGSRVEIIAPGFADTGRSGTVTGTDSPDTVRVHLEGDAMAWSWHVTALSPVRDVRALPLPSIPSC